MQTQAKIYALIRVSSSSQLEKYGPAAQEADIQGYAARTGGEIVHTRTYQESATKTDRPEFDSILIEIVRMSERGEIDSVVMGRQDRLSREGIAHTLTRLNSIEQAGVIVHFASGDVDSDSSMRELIYAVNAHADQGEAKKIRRRTYDGRKLRAKGSLLPTGSVPWCFRYEPKHIVGAASTGRPEIIAERAEWVRHMADQLLVEGKSLTSICKSLDESGVLPPRYQTLVDQYTTRPFHKHGSDECDYVHSEAEATSLAIAERDAAHFERYGRHTAPHWNKTTLSALLTNKALCGEFWTFNKTVKDESLTGSADTVYEPILALKDDDLAVLTAEQVDAIKEALEDNKKTSPRNQKRYHPPLKSRVYCHCGRIANNIYHRNKPAYRCLDCYRRDDCKLHITDATTMWVKVKAILINILSHPESIEDVLNEHLDSQENRDDTEARLKVIDNELSNIPEVITKLTRVFARLEVFGEDELLAEIDKLKERKGDLEIEREQLERSLKATIRVSLTRDRMVSVAKQLQGKLNTLDDDTWRSLLREFDVKVILEKQGGNTLHVSIDSDDTTTLDGEPFAESLFALSPSTTISHITLR